MLYQRPRLSRLVLAIRVSQGLQSLVQSQDLHPEVIVGVVLTTRGNKKERKEQMMGIMAEC